MSYADKLRDPRWQRRRLEIFQRDEWTCRDCGTSERELHVHHLAYRKGLAPWEYEAGELVTLCADCHERREALINAVVIGVQSIPPDRGGEVLAYIERLKPASSQSIKPTGSRSTRRLLRQTVVLILHYPSLVAQLTEDDWELLSESYWYSEDSGHLLTEALVNLRDLPANTRHLPANRAEEVIRRWCGSGEGAEDVRSILRSDGSPLCSVEVAADEVRDALETLRKQSMARRLLELEEKSRRGPLDALELRDFEAIMRKLKAR